MDNHFINYIGVKFFTSIIYKNYTIDLFLIKNYIKFNNNAVGYGWVSYKGYACYILNIPSKIWIEAIYKLSVKYGLY